MTVFSQAFNLSKDLHILGKTGCHHTSFDRFLVEFFRYSKETAHVSGNGVLDVFWFCKTKLRFECTKRLNDCLCLDRDLGDQLFE